MSTVNHESLKAQMDKTLTFAKVPHYNTGIETNINEWANRKYTLIEILRKHPKWNEDAMAIILEEKCGEAMHDDEFFALCADLRRMLSSKIGYDAADAWDHEGVYWDTLNAKVVTSELADEIRATNWEKYAKVKAGQKTSRYLRQLLLGMGVPNDCPEVWKVYAKIADAMNPVDITRPLIISVNPSDYLMMSYGDNWASCHIINPEIVNSNTNHYSGQSKIGCLSYMTDECSIITYTVNELPENLADLPITPRHTRQMFFLNLKSDQLMQSRMYPYTSDMFLIDTRRTIMQGVIAECLSLPNLWRKKNTDAGFVTIGRHYPDYEYVEDYYISVSYQSGRVFDNRSRQDIGSKALCLMCGDEVDENHMVVCSNCHDQFTCKYCGKPINIDDPDSYREIDGRNYHVDCTFWCAHCEEYHAGRSLIYVTNVGTVCSNAVNLSGWYVRLFGESGNEWILKERLPENAIPGRDRYFTSEAAAVRHGYRKCKRCGEWEHPWSGLTGQDDEWYCDRCIDGADTTCEHGHHFNTLIHGQCRRCTVGSSHVDISLDDLHSAVSRLNF